jgi:putative FmdB family regulatory protein
MPIYEYECENCCLRFEVKRSFSEDGGMSCPQCQGRACRLFSPVPIIFKGSGFYVTDSRKDKRSDGEKASQTENEKK